MQVNHWGPGGWTFLHSMTFNYPLEPVDYDKKRYTDYFKLTGEMLPCKYCRESYKIYIKYVPIEPFLDSREGICYWLYVIHNLVNDKIFKTKPTFKEIIIKYEKIRAKCGKVKKNKKKYTTCSIKFYDNVDASIVDGYLEKIKKYEPTIKKMLLKFMKSDENPNKLKKK